MFLLLLPAVALAQPSPEFMPAARARLTIPLSLPPLSNDDANAGSAVAAQRPKVIEYSHGYQVRAKIHRYASFATLPLFATELALGQSLYNNTPSHGSPRRGLHAAVGASIVGLFGANTVTGAWNMFGEGRKDPHGRTLRLVHGLLMMAADAGFVATAMSGPNSDRFEGAFSYESDKTTHRNLAIASIGIGTAGYLIMLLGNR